VEEHDLNVVFVPFQALDSVQHDNRIHEAIVAAMKHRGRATLLEWTDDVDSISRAFDGAECVIAMRLHAAVLACALQRPLVLMPYDHKVVEFGRLMGLRHQITPETLDNAEELHRVLKAGLNADWRTTRPFSDTWKTLTLAGPAAQTAVT
jgi:polysaccharide pyruvyl transferase WcaK-like protein